MGEDYDLIADGAEHFQRRIGKILLAPVLNEK